MRRAVFLVYLFGPVIAYAGILFYLSHQPVLPAPPTGDKLAHFGAYAVLGALLTRAFYFGTRWSLGLVFTTSALAASLYGISDEIHQSFVPGRSADVADVAADALGALVGAGIAIALYGLGQRRRVGSREAPRFTSP